MRTLSTSGRRASTRGRGDEERERALLQEFLRFDSVAALAGAIAARLGRQARPEDLIAEAGLAVGRFRR